MCDKYCKCEFCKRFYEDDCPFDSMGDGSAFCKKFICDENDCKRSICITEEELMDA